MPMFPNDPVLRTVVPDGSAAVPQHPAADNGYWNPDRAPVPTSARKWGLRDLAALWIALAACIPTYMLASRPAPLNAPPDYHNRCMTTDYNQIATQYKIAKLHPWRTFIERHTILSLLGDLRGKSALDLACGEGYYTRELRLLGATPVLGVDLSQPMIDLAQAEESNYPLGIQYQVGNALSFAAAGPYDLVFAAYLLNNARTADELSTMCRTIARCLKPGGRLVTVNNNSEEPPQNFGCGHLYGYAKEIVGKPAEGAPVIWRFFLHDGPIEVTNYLLSPATLQQSLHSAGLRHLTYHPPTVSAEGVHEYGTDHWRPFLSCPPIVFLTAEREAPI